ncbi:MAG: hypothetical protein M3Z25_14095 [Actinomycetota bacterium]|nr:hypothetical protein [Actinomycetota bacterium]
MAKMTRRTAIAVAGAGGGLLGLGYLLRGTSGPTAAWEGQVGSGGAPGRGMMGSGMMGSATQPDMSSYMEMFNRHTEIRRTVEEIPGGVRTTTESDAPDLIAQLQGHVTSMYSHVAEGAEVRCMSQSLPTLFRHAADYHLDPAGPAPRSPNVEHDHLPGKIGQADGAPRLQQAVPGQPVHRAAAAGGS